MFHRREPNTDVFVRCTPTPPRRTSRLLARWALLIGAHLSFAGACVTDEEAAPPGAEAPMLSGTDLAPTEAALHAAYVLAVQREASSEYDVSPAGHAVNPAQALNLGFEADSVTVEPHEGDWSLRLNVRSYGCPGVQEPLEASAPRVDPSQKNHVWQQHGPLTAWYLNGPLGLEQGFEVHAPPACGTDAEVQIVIGTDGLHPVSGPHQNVQLEDGRAAGVMSVNGLFVTDARGKALPSRLQVENDAVVIDIDPRGARYPLHVDPLWQHQQKLLAADGVANQRFGRSVSVSGDTALVTGHGGAYVFFHSGGTWTQQQKLTPPGVGPNDPIWSASVSGDAAAVPANGTVYAYTRSGTTWTKIQDITSPDFEPGDFFGSSVSLSGNTLVVGNSTDDDVQTEAGSAYVFVWTNGSWVFQQKLLPSNASPYSWFGRSVSVSGDTAVIGAINHLNDGAAYIYVRNGTTWTEQQTLLGFGVSPSSVDLFGSSVGVSGDTVVVGAPNVPPAGVAYAYLRSGGVWSLQETFTPPELPSTTYAFGRAVSVSGDSAVVGAGTNSGGIAYSFVRTGGAWTRKARLSALDSASGDEFGVSVAISGSTVVIGARDDDDLGTQSGSAHIYQVDASQDPPEKLVAPDPGDFDHLGGAVGISSDTVIVGAWGDDGTFSDSGSAYVFVKTGGAWQEQQKLTASDPGSNRYFGNAVAASGNTVVVGAQTDGNLGNEGSAYVFARAGGVWAEQAKLISSDGPWWGDDWFAGSVSISGDTVLVGASQNNGVGAVYVYDRSGSTWSESQKLTALLPASDWFGYSVDIAGNTAVVGAPNPLGSGIGSAYVFERTGGVWVQQQQLVGSDTAPGDWFGVRVSLSADTAIIGAHQDEDGGSGSGSAYVFVRNGSTWVEQQKLTASDAGAEDLFGLGVAVHGDKAVVGAYRDDDAGNDSGSAYVFVRAGGVWTEEKKLVAADGFQQDYFGNAVSIDVDQVVVGATWSGHNGWTRSGAAYVYGIAATGSVCGLNDECASGFCADGFCCDTACGDDDPNDCQACSAALTGEADGLCSPTNAGATCRPSVGDCDREEVCDGVGTACPADAVEVAGTTCRGATHDCDAEEVCDGASATCPSDVLVADGASCDDGDSCTQGDSCGAGICEPGQPVCGTGGAGGTGGNAEPPPPVEEGGGCTVAAGRSGYPQDGVFGLIVTLAGLWRRRARTTSAAPPARFAA